MSLCARIFLLVVLLVSALQPVAINAGGSRDFAGLIDIGGGRKMYLKCRGKGSPTVVLVSGLRASAEDWSVADKSVPAVFPEVAKFTRVCACDRPGTPVDDNPSRSDAVPQPTTARDAVADLHALLTAAGEAGRDKEGKPYSVRYDQVNAMLLNEFLKEHSTVQELKKEVAALTVGLQKVSA